MATKRSTTARRYAEAIFEIAERDGTVDQWLQQLTAIAAAVSDPGVARRLEDPQVPQAVRLDALLGGARSAGGAGGEMLPQMGNLLALILRRRRVESLPRIASEFRRLYNRRAGIVEAIATSAAPLGDQELAALRSRLEQMTSGRIELQTKVDPSLLGGIQVRIGDKLIDGSVRGRLERLRNRLAAGTLTS
ncbi:MAG: F0F1 ATP synthase subunit delta [Candidatus Limnocylindrales bacterium]